MTLQQALDSLTSLKQSLFQKYPIARMDLFGVARDEAVEASDVDILVEFSQPVGIEFMELAEELKASQHCKVDLVSRKEIIDHYFDGIGPDLVFV